MAENDQTPSIIELLEQADTPLEAVNALGKFSLRRAVELPLAIGRGIVEIVKHGDPAESISSSSSHLG